MAHASTGQAHCNLVGQPVEVREADPPTLLRHQGRTVREPPARRPYGCGPHLLSVPLRDVSAMAGRLLSGMDAPAMTGHRRLVIGPGLPVFQATGLESGTARAFSSGGVGPKRRQIQPRAAPITIISTPMRAMSISRPPRSPSRAS